MKTTQSSPERGKAGTHTLLSAEDKEAIKVAIERYKQTGKLIELKEIEKIKAKKKA